MTGASITITLDDAEARATLARLMLAVTDMSEPLGAVGVSLSEAARRRIAKTNVGPDGRAWKPSRRAIKKNGRTLQDEGHLHDTITRLATPTSVTVGTNRLYAAIHQFGGLIAHQTRRQTVYRSLTKARGLDNRFVEPSKANFASDHWVAGHVVRMPARPFLGVDDDDQGSIVAILRDHLARAIGGV